MIPGLEKDAIKKNEFTANTQMNKYKLLSLSGQYGNTNIYKAK